MLSIILKFFKILNSEDSPLQISLGIWFAFFMSFLSLLNPLALLVLFIVCMLRVNLTAFLLFWGLFVLIFPLYAPLLDSVGFSLLADPSMYTTWASVYQQGGASVAINNTVVLGGIVAAAVLLPLFILIVPKLVASYRERVLPYVNKLHIIQTLKASKLYQIYSNVS